jgi:integrase
MRKSFLTNEEEERLLKSLVSASTNIRDQLLITVALRTGARASELLAVRCKDLRHANKRSFLAWTKGFIGPRYTTS